MLFPTLGPSNLPVVVTQLVTVLSRVLTSACFFIGQVSSLHTAPDERHANSTVSVLYGVV